MMLASAKRLGRSAALAVLLLPSPARADVACFPVTRENVARCALRVSSAVQADREATAAATGRRVAASPWFPSNPTLGLSMARRAGTEDRASATNYAASLSQEIEIAGQRASRRRAAEAEVQARTQETRGTSRRVVAEAYSAFFEVLASRDALDVARRLESTAEQIARVTRGRADAGVTSPLDAEVADAASLRVTQARLEAERDLRTRSARLAALLGSDPTKGSVAITGALEPLPGVEALTSSNADSVRGRPEVLAFANEQRAYSSRAEAYRRARIPSLTVQLFAQNDGYNERVFGAGLSLPIPLPQPVGRTYTGEIREAEALARQTAAKSEVLIRDLSVDLATAVADYESFRKESELFTKERVARSERVLSEIGKEIEAGRLPVRDALLAQQQLIDVLRAAVETRRALCLASVQLALAGGVPLEDGGR